MTTSVVYWDGSDAVRVARDDWRDYPVEGVLWVDVHIGPYTTRLLGNDNYWIDPDACEFGVFNDPENAHIYQGRQAAVYRYYEEHRVELLSSRRRPKPGVHVVRGVWIPDEDARRVGVI
jgi:hypothetical protein